MDSTLIQILAALYEKDREAMQLRPKLENALKRVGSREQGAGMNGPTYWANAGERGSRNQIVTISGHFFLKLLGTSHVVRVLSRSYN